MKKTSFFEESTIAWLIIIVIMLGSIGHFFDHPSNQKHDWTKRQLNNLNGYLEDRETINEMRFKILEERSKLIGENFILKTEECRIDCEMNIEAKCINTNDSDQYEMGDSNIDCVLTQLPFIKKSMIPRPEIFNLK